MALPKLKPVKKPVYCPPFTGYYPHYKLTMLGARREVLHDFKAAALKSLASGDQQEVQHLLSREGGNLKACKALEVAYLAIKEGHEGIGKQLLGLPSVTDKDREGFLRRAVENSWQGIVRHLLVSTGTQVPFRILNDVQDTETLDVLLAAVPAEKHVEVLLGQPHDEPYSQHLLLDCSGTRLLLQQYKQQWEVRQEAEELKAVAQQMLVGAIATHKGAQTAAAGANEETRGGAAKTRTGAAIAAAAAFARAAAAAAAAAMGKTAVSAPDTEDAAAEPAASSRKRMRR
jgi:hypothetical protein